MAHVPAQDNPMWDPGEPVGRAPQITVHPPKKTQWPVGFAPWPDPAPRKKKRRKKK